MEPRSHAGCRRFPVIGLLTPPLEITLKHLYMSTITATTSREIADAQQHAFGALSLTYEQLATAGTELLQAQGMGAQQVANISSALRLWLRVHGFVPNKAVGRELAEDFDLHLMRFQDINAERLAPRTQRDRQEQMLRWKAMAKVVRATVTLPMAFGEAVFQCLECSSLTRRAIAAHCGITTQCLYTWCQEKFLPIGSGTVAVEKLEQLLELPTGTLVGRLPMGRRTRYSREKGEPLQQSAYSARCEAQRMLHPNYCLSFTPRIKSQWVHVLSLKTDPMRPFARARNTWRLKEISKVSTRVTEPMMFHGRVCVTAGVHWNFIASYLGFLKLAPPHGYGMEESDVDTLAWLACPEHVLRYTNWLKRKSGDKISNGVVHFLTTVESYLRPQTGYLWLTSALASTLPPDALLGGGGAEDKDVVQLWQKHCEATRERVRQYRTRAIETIKVSKSRDSTEQITDILSDVFPLKRLVAFQYALEQAPPPCTHHRDYIVWLRDVVLCKMLISNPLRIGQYAAMTYLRNGKGNLFQAGLGRWQLRFSPEDFKNEKGAAAGPYQADVDATIGPWIDRYLSESRPHLVDEERTDRFFLPAVRGVPKVRPFLEALGLSDPDGFTSDSLGKRVTTLTRIYIPDSPGFGPQSFRHIIATDHLKRHPSDYVTVATLLHDTLATVLRHYGHLKVNDGLRVLQGGVQLAKAELESERLVPG